MADGVKSTIILTRKTSALRRKEKLVGDSPRRKDKPIDTSKLRTCTKAARNLESSPLLCLPAELRNRIYTLVLQPECVLVRSRYFTAFDMTVELRSCCSSVPPTKSQAWVEGKSMTLLPVICRQLYKETHCLLYALNTFAFTDEQSMRTWISCRTRNQRKQIRSLKLPKTATGYYRSPHEISLAAVYPQLQTIYIDIWRVVVRENHLEELDQDNLLQLLAAEKVNACEKEGDKVNIVATEYVYRSTLFGAILVAA